MDPVERNPGQRGATVLIEGSESCLGSGGVSIPSSRGFPSWIAAI